MFRDTFWLTDEQFARLEPLLPSDTRGKPRVDDRRVISGIVHGLKSGCRWADAPEVYGPHKTLYHRFVRWAAKGVWHEIFLALAAAGGPPAQVLIDSSVVRAHRCAAGVTEGPRERKGGASAGHRALPRRPDQGNMCRPLSRDPCAQRQLLPTACLRRAGGQVADCKGGQALLDNLPATDIRHPACGQGL